MKQKIKSYIALFLILCMALPSVAQDRRTLDTKVADILAQMPTNDFNHLDRLMDETLKLGSEGLEKFTSMLTPTGKGDDVAVRFVINGLTRYTSQFGHEAERALWEKTMLNTLSKQKDNSIKVFVIRQLKLMGGEATVKAITPLLSDEVFCEPVAQTLLTIASASAADAFMAYLPKADGKNLVTVVQAAGTMKLKAAVPTITKYVNSEDLNLRKASLAALAHIGSADSYSTLYKAAKSISFGYDAANTTAAFMTYVDQLAANNELALAKKACATIVKANQAPEQLHLSATALKIYAKYFGSEVEPMLFKQVTNSDKAYRCAVLNVAQCLGDVEQTRAWIEKAKESTPAVKADIVAMLGRRGCPMASPFLKSQMTANNEAVRAAALRAYAQVNGVDALPALISYLEKGQDLKVTEKIINELMDKKHLGCIVKAMDKYPDASKAIALNVIAAKSGKAYFQIAYDATSSSNKAIKNAAYKALPSTACSCKTDALISLLLKTDGSDHIANVQKAIYNAVVNSEDPAKGTDKLLAALSNTNKKDRITMILPRLGGDKALNAVNGLIKQSKYKEAAFNALVNWKDISASAKLYEICKSDNSNYGKKAFEGFVSQVKSSSLPVDQKLLQLRKIMPYAKNLDQQKKIIKSLANIKTFLSMVYTSQYLDNKDLQQEAAASIMKIALPSNGQKVGLYGEEVRTTLNKVISVMKGQESDYHKTSIRTYLNNMPKDKGYVSMFNGKDLSGWKGLVANPVKRAKMSAAQLAKAQKEADAKMYDNWSVKDNSIVFNGHGANLCSAKDYEDFEMICDWRITKRGDSGIYLRGTPQVQIWDTSRVEVGAQVGSGGLYNNKKHLSKPLKVADNLVGEWNTFRIKMIGEKVTVYLNGELVVDNVTMDNYWDRSIPIFSKGAIELQAHGTDLAFRNIYVKELNEKDYGLTEEEKAEGFTALFNGKNLDNWIGNKTDYLVEDGIIAVRPKQGGHGNLYTEKEYSDFVYRFEFKLTPGANNGLGIHAPLEGDAAYVGKELQILDNTAPIYANLKPYQYHGSVYGMIAAKRGFQKPVGEWNTEEVIVKGTHIKITLNGEVIVDGDVQEFIDNGTPDHRDHPGLKRQKGHIAYLGHGSVVFFRNIRIKDLSN
ncbi:DUF1080 domain-containing protein [Puteibacter caeruleilacunae]|nr:DUF1080 domain-containing protein [Puteibacter caeruleilacunae]